MNPNRRQFLQGGAALGLAAVAPAASSPGRRLVGEAALLPRWRGRWPRLAMDADDLQALRRQMAERPELARAIAPTSLPRPNLNAEESRTLTPELGKLERAAFLWRLTGEDRFRVALRSYFPLLPRLVALPVRLHRGPNAQDLDAGHTLRALAFAYDWLRGGDWPEAQVRELGHALAVQARVVYEELRDVYPAFAYDQNHGSIPVSGLGLAGWAMYGDEPEAPAWAGWARNYLDRTAEVLGGDGFYYEGGSYYTYGFPCVALHAVVLKRLSGEDWTGRAVFRDLEQFVAHLTLPGRRFIFDFGDWGPRKGQAGYEQPWHTRTSAMTTWPLVALSESGATTAARDAVIAWLPANWEPFYALWRGSRRIASSARDLDPAIVPAHRHFPSHDALFWRSSWNDPEATAALFKCGPPLGHHAAPLVARYPEWRSNAGHVHPDAGQFLLWTRGRFVAGDTGYTAKKYTREHNSLLVEGQGQLRDGRYHAFRDVDYARLDQLRLTNVWSTAEAMAATAVLEAGYDPALGVRRLRRHLLLVAGKWVLICDEMTAEAPRALSFLWHTDCELTAAGSARWLLRNGPAAALLVALDAPAAAPAGPAMVEAYTGVPDHGEPLQRGWRLELKSAPATRQSLWRAFILNPGDVAAARVERVSESEVRLADAKETASLTIDRSGAGDRVRWSYRLGEGPRAVAGP